MESYFTFRYKNKEQEEELKKYEGILNISMIEYLNLLITNK